MENFEFSEAWIRLSWSLLNYCPKCGRECENEVKDKHSHVVPCFSITSDEDTLASAVPPSQTFRQNSKKSVKAGKPQRSKEKGNVKSEECKICGKCFRERTSLKNHILSHTGEKPFPCDKCDKRFRRKESLNYHMHSHESNKTKNFICPHCAKPFRSLRDLKGHEKFLHRDSQECKECKQRFTDKVELAEHMIMQHNQPHKCSECDLEVPNMTKLKEHIRKVHRQSSEVIKPFQCEFCDKTFRLKHQKDIHEKRHSIIRKYACQLCNKSFPQISEYRKHLQIHEDKNFSCSICDKSFRSLGILTKHMYKHEEKNNETVLENKVSGEAATPSQVVLGHLPPQPPPPQQPQHSVTVVAQQPQEAQQLQLLPQEKIGRLAGVHVDQQQLAPEFSEFGFHIKQNLTGVPLQTISVKTEKFRTIDDVITTKTVYVMDPDVPDSDSTTQPGGSAVLHLPYHTLGVPQYTNEKEVGGISVIQRTKLSLPDQHNILESIKHINHNV